MEHKKLKQICIGVILEEMHDAYSKDRIHVH
jgi:hypothetical protein